MRERESTHRGDKEERRGWGWGMGERTRTFCRPKLDRCCLPTGDGGPDVILLCRQEPALSAVRIAFAGRVGKGAVLVRKELAVRVRSALGLAQTSSIIKNEIAYKPTLALFDSLNGHSACAWESQPTTSQNFHKALVYLADANVPGSLRPRSRC